MIRLSINIDKIATLRNARGGNIPNVVEFAKICEKFGATGITIHPRQDQRHIKKHDVYNIKKTIKTELNIEGYPHDDFIEMVLAVRPNQVTFVPDSRNVLTSDSGWDLIKNYSFLTPIIKEIRSAKIRTSLFVDPHLNTINAAADLGTDRIELYTGDFANNFIRNKKEAINPFIKASELSNKLGLEVNAGHDLNLKNLHYFAQHIPNLKEVSIGHALICDSLYFGIEKVIQLYLRALKV